MSSDANATKLQRFDEQVLLHLDALYRAALRLTGKAADAEDLVQETCLRAFQAFDQLKHPQAARAWVFAILRSVFLRQAGRRSLQPVRLSLEDLDGAILAHTLGQGDVSPVRQTLLEEVRRATLKLPEPYREALILAHIGGFSYREMAHILEVPLGTVMSRLFRARRMLRASLAEPMTQPSPVEPER
jgi:RNA polymerase sigma-70 factor (ECF subfamily)